TGMEERAATTRRGTVQFNMNGSRFGPPRGTVRVHRMSRFGEHAAGSEHAGGRITVSATALPCVSSEYNQSLTSQLALHFHVPGDPRNEFPLFASAREMRSNFNAGQSVNAILSRIRELQPDLPPKAKQIAELIFGQPESFIHMSITEVAET